MGSSPPGLNDLHINGNPKNQLHDSIEKIQSLHKRKNALKATYDHERSDLRARHEKSTQALEGLICSTEEQVQSIGEVRRTPDHVVKANSPRYRIPTLQMSRSSYTPS